MKMKIHPDMVEATRLTREGRLTEATALIQRLLQGGKKPDARGETASRATAIQQRRGSANDFNAVRQQALDCGLVILAQCRGIK